MPHYLRRRPALWLTLLGLAAVACYSAGGCRSAGTSTTPEPVEPVTEDDDDGGGGWKLPPNDRPDLWEFRHRMTSFVTDRPDLSAPPSAGRDAALAGAVDPYFATVGLQKSDARDLLVALDDAALLMRFRLDQPQLKRFLKDKRELKEAPADLLAGFYGEETVSVDGPRQNETAGFGFGFLAQYPFVRLTWWPVSQEQVAGMVAYEGKLKWNRNESHVGATYYLFVKDKTGLVYLLGW